MSSPYHFKDGRGRRWTRGAMKFGQSWDAEAQNRHNDKRGRKGYKKYILTTAQEIAETVRLQQEEG